MVAWERLGVMMSQPHSTHLGSLWVGGIVHLLVRVNAVLHVTRHDFRLSYEKVELRIFGQRGPSC